MVMYLKGHGLNYKLLPITLQNVTNYTELQIILSINLSCSSNLHPLFFRMFIKFGLTIIILLTQLKVNVTMAALGTVCRSGRLFRCLPSIVNGNVSNRYLMI